MDIDIVRWNLRVNLETLLNEDFFRLYWDIAPADGVGV